MPTNGSGRRRREAVRVMDDLRKRDGLIALIARQLKISKQAVHQWELVPTKRLKDVARITKIAEEQLRPDLFGR